MAWGKQSPLFESHSLSCAMQVFYSVSASSVVRSELNNVCKVSGTEEAVFKSMFYSKIWLSQCWYNLIINKSNFEIENIRMTHDVKKKGFP